MRMTQGHGQGIGRIFLGQVGQSQHGFYHMLHLRLGSIALADDGFFDLGGCVFMHWQVTPGHHTDRCPTRLAQFESRVGIAVHKDLLNRDDGGLMLIQDFGYPFNQNTQPTGEVLTLDPNATAADPDRTACVHFDDAIASKA